MSLHLVPRVLNYIEAVAEHGSIQAASRAINISASAIDRQIVLLEDRLDVQLFDRDSTGMELTVAGEMFVVLSRRWRADENRIFSDVNQMQGVDMGEVRLVTMDSLVNGLIPGFLAKVARDYPRVQIDVEIATPDEALATLIEGKADLALGFNFRPARNIHVLWTTDLPLVCIAAPDHPLASSQRVRIKEVRAHPLVVQSQSLAIRRILDARYPWMFTQARPPVVTNSLQLLKQLVVSGGHVALTSKLDAAPELAGGQLVAMPIVDQAATSQTISLAVSAHRTLPKICRTISSVLEIEITSVLESIPSDDVDEHQLAQS